MLAGVLAAAAIAGCSKEQAAAERPALSP